MRTSLVGALLGAGLVLSFASPAYAYKYTGTVWSPSDFPIPFHVSTYLDDSLPADDPNYEILASEEGFAQWGMVYDSTSATPDQALNDVISPPDGPAPAAPCAGLSATYAGTCDNTAYLLDYTNSITFDDPAQALGSGILCATLVLPPNGPIVFNKLGRTFTRAQDGDIVCNDNVDWARDSDVLAGHCSNETDLRAVLTHEIGHFWGMGHSCDENDACQSQDLKEATMFWTAANCDDSPSTLAPDDITGISQLYGPSAETVCNHELDPSDANTKAFGVTPWTLSCEMKTDSAADITSTAWYFGDQSTGTPPSGLTASHDYTTDGNFTLEVDVAGHNDSCGDWNYQIRKPGYVLSCSVPSPEFTITHSDGLTYQLVNNTSVHTYGCIYDIEWDIYDSLGNQVKSLKAWEPEFEFPAEGSYRVVLNVGGPAGTGAAELTFDVKDTRGTGYGCDSSGSGLGDLGLVAAILLGTTTLRKRRV